MFSHIPSQLTDAAVPDWSGYGEAKWLWRTTNSHGPLSLGANITAYRDLPVDVRTASIFGSWLLRRGDAWLVSIQSQEGLFLMWLLSVWFDLTLVCSAEGLSPLRQLPVHFEGQGASCAAWDVAGVPQNLLLQGLRIRQTVLQRARVPFPWDFLFITLLLLYYSVGVIRL